MDITSTSFEWILLALFVVNFMAVLLVRHTGRYWFPAVVFWLFLFFAFIIGNAFYSSDVTYEETKVQVEQLKSTEPLPEESYVVKQVKQQKQQFSNRMFHLLGFQTLLSLLWMGVGYKSSGLPFYRSGVLTFIFLFLLYLLLLLLRLL